MKKSNKLEKIRTFCAIAGTTIQTFVMIIQLVLVCYYLHIGIFK